MGPPKARLADLSIAYLREVRDRAAALYAEYTETISTKKLFADWLGEEHLRLMSPAAKGHSPLLQKGEVRGELLAAIRVIWLREAGYGPKSPYAELNALAKSLGVAVHAKTLAAALARTEELWARVVDGDVDSPVEIDDETSQANEAAQALLCELFGRGDVPATACSESPSPAPSFRGQDLFSERTLDEVILSYFRDPLRTELRVQLRRIQRSLPLELGGAFTSANKVLEALVHGADAAALSVGLRDLANRIRVFADAHRGEVVDVTRRALADDQELAVSVRVVGAFAAWCAIELPNLDGRHRAQRATLATPIVSLWRAVGPVMSIVEALQVEPKEFVADGSEPYLVVALTAFERLLAGARSLVPHFRMAGFEPDADAKSWAVRWPWRSNGAG